MAHFVRDITSWIASEKSPNGALYLQNPMSKNNQNTRLYVYFPFLIYDLTRITVIRLPPWLLLQSFTISHTRKVVVHSEGTPSWTCGAPPWPEICFSRPIWVHCVDQLIQTGAGSSKVVSSKQHHSVFAQLLLTSPCYRHLSDRNVQFLSS